MHILCYIITINGSHVYIPSVVQQVLVHGEQNEMMRLKTALIREYEENDETLQIHSPANAEAVSLHFRGEKMAKVIFRICNYIDYVLFVIESSKPLVF